MCPTKRPKQSNLTMASVYIAHSSGGSLELKSPYCTTNTTAHPDHWRDSGYSETRGQLGTVTSGYVMNNPPGDDSRKFDVRPRLCVPAKGGVTSLLPAGVDNERADVHGCTREQRLRRDEDTHAEGEDRFYSRQ